MPGLSFYFLQEAVANVKDLYLCVPDPFDSSTGARLERMGILRPDGEVNVEVMRAFVQIFGGLFFDDLCDSTPIKERCLL